ncbi:hypothetical protein ALON55S_08381 [Alishewanella longhuensis]
MPRFGFNWRGLDNTVIRGGLGRLAAVVQMCGLPIASLTMV